MKKSYVYIMGNRHLTTFYTGVTNDIAIRVHQHKAKLQPAFTKTYNCDLLLYYEEYHDIRDAIAREKQLKNWKREWKQELIRSSNPDMTDLAADW